MPEPREWLLTKRCSICGATKPWAKFSPREYWPDGKVRRLQSRCHDCEPRSVRRYRDVKGRRAYQDEWQRRRREEVKADRKTVVLLPIEPFRAWVLEQYEKVGTWDELGAILGVEERRLRSVARVNVSVTLPLVEKCLTAAGEHLSALYGEDVLLRELGGRS